MTVFFRVPRTASTTLRLSFNRGVASIPEEIRKHNRYHTISHEYKSYKEQLIYLHYFKKYLDIRMFAFVRNPYFRLVSSYLFNIHANSKSTPSHLEACLILRTKYKCFGSLCENLKEISSMQCGVHFVPQHYWIYEKDTCLMDHIGKYEDLKNEYKRICSALDIPFKFERYKHHSDIWSGDDYREYYKSERTKELVRSFYSRDLKLFGYSKEL